MAPIIQEGSSHPLAWHQSSLRSGLTACWSVFTVCHSTSDSAGTSLQAVVYAVTSARDMTSFFFFFLPYSFVSFYCIWSLFFTRTSELGHDFLKKLSWKKTKMKMQLLQILAETRWVSWGEGFVLISRNCTNSLEQENLHLTIEPFSKLWHVELI